MRKIILTIVIILLLSFCFFPLQLDYSYGDTNIHSEKEEKNDDAVTKNPEQKVISFVQHNKKLKIEKYLRYVRRLIAKQVLVVYSLEFNCNGVLNDVIKRDYSGDREPVNIICRCGNAALFL